MKRIPVSQDMPGWARLIAGIMASGLLTLGMAMLLTGLDRDWKQLLIAFTAAGLGVDLLIGAIRARWPISALLWIVPP